MIRPSRRVPAGSTLLLRSGASVEVGERLSKKRLARHLGIQGDLGIGDEDEVTDEELDVE